MDRRSFLTATTLAAAGTVAPKIGHAASSKTYVLVHGAWHGGWCWSKVTSILRGRGHTVVTPTQTGLGERSHLLSKSIDLDVFVTDITNVIKYEDLNDIDGRAQLRRQCDLRRRRHHARPHPPACLSRRGDAGERPKRIQPATQGRRRGAHQSSAGN